MIINIFSRRQKQHRGEMPDVYVYDDLPLPLKKQIIHILRDTLGDENHSHHEVGKVRETYSALVKTLCREYGLFGLGKNLSVKRTYITEFFDFILEQPHPEMVLDAVELAFRAIDLETRDAIYLHRGNKASRLADAAIEELNVRFNQHGVGYRFEEGEIIRVDSELLHVEVVKPALALLHAPQFDGAQAEFLKAHEHYRHGRTKEALAECLKSLESTIKSICVKRNWAYAPNATSSTLINILFQKNLIPNFWCYHFSGLRATLEGGVPTARNNLGGHGQGVEVTEVPMPLVSYVLHQTAAAIVFLVKSEEILPQD